MKTDANKTAIINFLATLILQGVAFLSTPLFTRMLGTEQYGIYSLFYSWSLILTCVMGLSLSASISTGYYNFKDKYIQFRNTLLLCFTLICVCELLLIVVFRNGIAPLLKLDSQVIVLTALTAMGHAIVNFGQLCFIYEKKAWSNFALSVSVALISVGLSVYLIYQCAEESRYYGRLYGTAIPYLFIALIVWILLFKEKPTALHKEYVKYGVVVGMPIMFHSLSQLVLGQSDRVMMQAFGLPLSDIGIYSLFYLLSAVLSTILSALNNSWCPFYYDDVNEENWEVLDKKCKNYIELFSVLEFGFLLLSREVSYLLGGENYSRGVDIIPILAFAVYFTFMYQFPVNFEFFHKKTKIIAVGTVGAAVLNIILNAIMIPLWGMYGAAFATALSYLALFVAHFSIVTHMKEHPYHLKFKEFIPGLGAMAIGTTSFYLLDSLWYIRWGMGIALGCFELYRIKKRKTLF